MRPIKFLLLTLLFGAAIKGTAQAQPALTQTSQKPKNASVENANYTGKLSEVPAYIKDEGQLAHPGDKKISAPTNQITGVKDNSMDQAKPQLRAEGAPAMQPNTDSKIGEKKDYTRGSPSNLQAPQQSKNK